MSELHTRLEYLISYSSQLIFVGCDSVSQQQSTLQHIVSLQHDNTEIAYLSGSQVHTDQTYRHEIYKQLTSDAPLHGFKLNDDLIDKLSPESGPVLICICEADFISEQFLCELWDLVNQNKDHASAHHLNVILFAQSAWTHQAKSILANKHSQTPILLSTETVSTNEGLSEFDAIRQNRQRIQNNQVAQNTGIENQSVIRQPWFKLLASALFIALFGLIIFWQYPEEIQQFLSPEYTDSEQLAEQQTPDIFELGREVDSTESVPSFVLNADESAKESSLIETQDSVSSVGPEDSSINNKSDIDGPATSNNQLKDELEGESPFVTSWLEEVDKLNDQEKTTEHNANDPESEPEQAPVVQDYDISEIAKISSLNDVQAGQFLLQLSAMADPLTLNQFVTANGLENETWIYTTQRFGGDWHVALLAQSFGSLQAAREHVNQLPDSIDKSQPFAKSIEQVREEQQK